MRLQELQNRLIMMNYLARSSMDNRNINEEDNVAYDRDATLTNKVSNKKESTPTTPTNRDPLQWVKNALKGVDLTDVIKTPKVDQNVSTQERKAEIDAKINRGGYTPPSIYRNIDMSQVEENEKRAEQAKADAEAEAQEAKEAKHRKAEKMWSAIGDGISAIANMATVGAGADSMYNPADSLHSKIKSKWDEIKANKAAIAAANRKAQMDLLLKEYELGAKAKEAEANRNFNIWKAETEESGRNQRAKTKQEFDAEQNKQKNEATLQAARIRGRSGGGGGGSSSTGKYFFNGVAYKSASERNQAILSAAKKYQYDVYDDDDKLRDWDVMAVELEELMAEGEPQPQPGNYAQRWGSMFGGNSTSVPSAKPSKASTPTKPKDNAAVTP